MCDFLKKPYQFTHHFEHQLPSGNKVELFFDVRHATIVKNLYFQGQLSEDEYHLFQLCCQLAQGVELEDIGQFSWRDLCDLDEVLEQQGEQEKLPLICYPLYLIQGDCYELLGQSPVLEQEKDKLVCFCFSITEQEILTFLEQHPQATLFDLTNALNVGGACQSCVTVLEHMIIQQRKVNQDYSSLSIERIEMVLQEWKELENYFKLGLLHLEHWDGKENLEFKVSNPDKFMDLAWQIENYLFQQLSLYFVVNFKHF